MMRKQLVTVRWPGASIAPANKIRVCRQTRAENTGVKVLKRETNKGGNNSKEDHFLGHLQSTGPLRMAKVEIRGYLFTRYVLIYAPMFAHAVGSHCARDSWCRSHHPISPGAE